MTEIMEKAEALQNAIRESTEYTEYINMQGALQKEPDLYERLNEYRRRSFEIQLSDDVDAHTKLEKLHGEFSDFLADGKVSRFIRAEQAFCKLMRQVNEKILGGIQEMDISFL